VQGVRNQVEAKLIGEKVMDFLAEHAEITYVDVAPAAPAPAAQ
jgi:transcriptional regulator NrdR family protein